MVKRRALLDADLSHILHMHLRDVIGQLGRVAWMRLCHGCDRVYMRRGFEPRRKSFVLLPPSPRSLAPLPLDQSLSAHPEPVREILSFAYGSLCFHFSAVFVAGTGSSSSTS